MRVTDARLAELNKAAACDPFNEDAQRGLEIVLDLQDARMMVRTLRNSLRMIRDRADRALADTDDI